MPEWLLQNEKYTPLKDKDSFIDKSILSILAVIAKLNFMPHKKERFSSVNANVKVISAIVIVILAATSRSLLFLLTIDIILFLIVSLLSVQEIKNILRVSFVMAVFTFVILLPSIIFGNINNSILIILKILATVTSINILSHITQWHKMTGALKMFFIPDIFIFVLDITVKYILILGELSVSMLYALKARAVGRSKDKYASLSGIIGTMFIKSKVMAEEMHSAMECRGFTGEYKVCAENKLGLIDYAFIVMDILLVLMFIFFR